ncbi:hypothetical protein [Kordia jejudonensis]|uniref:hypothetical protein n=1 Tax=Kordia jejudonensis TaxID=1348245 RepID=UPI000699FDA9|nr:hypothetical protein [Kordia jejudonensis]
MKQNIKNTLYRFVTMRAPELVGDLEKALGFTQFPENETSVFIDSASQATTTEAKKLAIETAISGYTVNFSSKKDLENNNIYFYHFAIWLTANRTKFSLEEVTARINAFYAPNSTYPDMTQVWDDLHYNILTNGDPYLRDMLLSWLVADFFLRQRNAVDQSAEALQKLAQARVVIDKSLFTNEVATAPTDKEAPISEKTLKKEMDAFMAQENVKELKKIAKEVQKVAKKYKRENQVAKDAYQKTYDLDVKNAYAAATIVERVVTDPDTGETSVIEEYQNLTIPPYNFPEDAQLDKTILESRLSAEAANYVTDVETEHGLSTLNEVSEVISEEIQTNTAAAFSNVDFGSTQVVTGGISVPVFDSSTQPFDFRVCSRVPIGGTIQSIIMVVRMPNSSYNVANMTYNVEYADASNNTDGYFEETKSGNSIVLRLYNNGIDLDSPTTEFSGTITFTNGDSYDFVVPNFVKSKCYVGKIKPANGSSTTTPTQAPVAYGIQRLGIADYRKVEQEVCCYVPGEVSHIENIMAREYKSKDIKRTRRQETTDTFSNETERENLTETTSTDRFEMNQEISSMNAQDQSVSANVGVYWGNPGGFGGNASASFANNTSSEDSETQAITHAKELTERALDRVVQKIREERVTKVVEEYEENTSHGYDNRKGDKHISGVYRWVDKVYRNKILNYGKRLMYEFMVPEPASFHDLAIQLKDNAEILVKPVDPRTASGNLNMKDYASIDEENYKHWAAIYNAEVTAMPTENISITKSYSKDNMISNSGRWAHEAYETIEIPENYRAFEYNGYFTAEHGHFEHGPVYPRADVVIGGQAHTLSTRGKLAVDGLFTGQNLINSLDLSVTSWDVGSYAFNLRVDCMLMSAAKQAWQMETFNTIIEAYEERLAEFEEKYAAQKESQTKFLEINPGFYREIERTVLRKNCISYLVGQENVGEDMIDNRNTLSAIIPKYTSAALDRYAAKVKFFEQAFEWDIMSYNFYPFYWASKEKWDDLYQVQNNDPLFKAFLQSGMARVIITVRPGFEEMVNWYLATGQIWNGGQVPTLNDDEFVSIVEELRNPESEVEETWETRVPTSLTVIQAGAIGLDVEGLPCDTDCDDWLQFDSDGNPVLDEDGNPVSTNPISQSDELIGGGEGVGSETVNPIIVQ